MTRDVLSPGVSRRVLLGAGVGGVLLVGLHLPTGGRSAAAQPGTPFNAFIRIDREGAVTLVMPQVEMGQGVYTSISMILAEELDADFARVRVEHAPPDEAHYTNPMLGVQATGNSNSIRGWWMPLRKAGAGTRAVLVQAAAQRWGVAPGACRTEAGQVIHPASDRRLGYGDLVGRAAALKVPSDPPLKTPGEFRLVGKPLKRLDTPEKVNGKTVYGIDVRPPGCRYATLMASPVKGGTVASVDDAEARLVPGVQQVVVLDDLVAVVGEHMWAAKRGLEALKITWNDGPNGQVDSAQVWAQIRKASAQEGVVARQRGDADKALAGGQVVTAEFEMPFLAHAAMEPMNCTALVTPGGCELWLGAQAITRVQSHVAQALGLPPAKVKINQHLLGGGFGRRLEADMAVKSARIAQKVDGPVKVVWTREEDIRQDIVRPVYHDRIWAKLSGDRIVAWKYRITGSAVIARWLPPGYQKGVDPDAVDSAVDIPYDVPDLRVEYVRDEPPGVSTGFWRGVGPNNNVFAIESFIDELAKKAGKDPVAFRRANLGKSPRLRAVLDLAAEQAGWGSPLPPRCGRGVATQVSFGSFIATVVEVEVDEDGDIHLKRANIAVDTGIAVNPDTIIAQLQGGLIFGLTAALYGEITLDKGRIQQSNFHDYRMLRIDQTPPIAVHLVKSGEPAGGIGEAGTTAAFASLRNAIYAATGKPLRRIPFNRELLAKGAGA
ncbi:molybdopterin cofactor-binding domain-containing protein [uncultured Phenylobacterium sp.]|uniref:xanthine dehydrogenase family protein molybdopterin-binding subunit n=1 Tax=uncultured Phenylobacterium sp. TaxID=349273 RepID=UPI0025DDBC9B|nr:molybdopterin cofactor-binding domain-containing protein [uncultured Phenylobacterium sp.]